MPVSLPHGRAFLKLQHSILIEKEVCSRQAGPEGGAGRRRSRKARASLAHLWHHCNCSRSAKMTASARPSPKRGAPCEALRATAAFVQCGRGKPAGQRRKGCWRWTRAARPGARDNERAGITQLSHSRSGWRRRLLQQRSPQAKPKLPQYRSRFRQRCQARKKRTKRYLKSGPKEHEHRNASLGHQGRRQLAQGGARQDRRTLGTAKWMTKMLKHAPNLGLEAARLPRKAAMRREA